jgi:5-methylcytosine-specific restriction endonuclease McrA
MKSKRTRELEISQDVKRAVFVRDIGCCILCGNPYKAAPNAHYIPRSKGGLGIEENVVTLCWEHHDRLDHTTDRKMLLEAVKAYLDSKYPGFPDSERVYRK